MNSQQTPTNAICKAHLLVGIPACGRMTTIRWAMNLTAQVFPLSMTVDYLVVNGKEAGEARNNIAQCAKDVKAKLLLMVDDDVLPPHYAVQKMLSALLVDERAMACAGIVYTKMDVPSPLVFANRGEGPFYGWKRDKVFEVPGFISTGCMLVRVEAFDKIEQPWFKTSDYPEQETEDAYFCTKLKKAGYKVLGHGGVLCGHYDSKTKKVVEAPPDVALISAQFEE